MKNVLLIMVIFVLSILIEITLSQRQNNTYQNKLSSVSNNSTDDLSNKEILVQNTESSNNIIMDDWKIRLVNYANPLPEDFKVDLVNIDSTRQFDKRAIEDLFAMMQAMKKEGIYNVWVQSSYRSLEYQKSLFENKIKKYMAKGINKKDAERLTLQTINKPGTSEHNLGLAVDFNYVDYSFDKTNGFKWLQNNAENYGFIMRYRKDKEEITKVDYEPWHWRYVGIEHSKEINRLDMCLEEYVEYLKNI